MSKSSYTKQNYDDLLAETRLNCPYCGHPWWGRAKKQQRAGGYDNTVQIIEQKRCRNSKCKRIWQIVFSMTRIIRLKEVTINGKKAVGVEL